MLFTVPLHSLMYNTQRLNRRNRGWELVSAIDGVVCTKEYRSLVRDAMGKSKMWSIGCIITQNWTFLPGSRQQHKAQKYDYAAIVFAYWLDRVLAFSAKIACPDANKSCPWEVAVFGTPKFYMQVEVSRKKKASPTQYYRGMQASKIIAAHPRY